MAATGGLLTDCSGLASADVGIAAPGSAEAVQQAADVVMSGGALDTIIDAIELGTPAHPPLPVSGRTN